MWLTVESSQKKQPSKFKHQYLFCLVQILWLYSAQQELFLFPTTRTWKHSDGCMFWNVKRSNTQSDLLENVETWNEKKKTRNGRRCRLIKIDNTYQEDIENIQNLKYISPCMPNRRNNDSSFCDAAVGTLIFSFYRTAPKAVRCPTMLSYFEW